MAMLRSAIVLILSLLSLSQAQADTPVRRAFVVGIERYRDGDIQSLSRAVADAKDFAKDLEQVGFDPKNVTVATDVANKADFNKKFDAFLKTVKNGDFVVFFFSGHGMGVERTNSNYLLFGDAKGPVTFTKERLDPADRKNLSVVKARVSGNLDAYNDEEIPKFGISTKEIEDKIADQLPSTAVLVLDACRNMLRPDPGEDRIVKRTRDSGSRLLPDPKPRDGFLTLYSASFGEQAVESFDGQDTRRNSLFVEVLRSELMRPGQSLVELADRVSRVVRDLADAKGRQQVPEYFFDAQGSLDDTFLVDTIGERRFAMTQEKCEHAQESWDRIARRPRRDQIEQHIRTFDGCKTVEGARRILVGLSDGSVDVMPPPSITGRRPVDLCDQLAASDSDRARPSEVPGVRFAAIDGETAITACKDSVVRNPRVPRYLFNLGRAYAARANGLDPTTQASERDELFRLSRLAYDDAQKAGYVAAIYNLGVMYGQGLGGDRDTTRAIDLYKRAAQQGFPLAMYELARRYRAGTDGIRRDDGQAYEWFAKASESGLAEATVEVGRQLWSGTGLPKGPNPRRAVETLQNAADLGSNDARYLLGRFYFFGQILQNPAVSLKDDNALALLWLGRAAESNDPNAQYLLAQVIEGGYGLPNAQPDVAERYWRLAAYGGNSDAEVEFADRLRRGQVLTKPENGQREAITLLERAFSQGSARAALELARIYRTGDSGAHRDPIMAMKYAYQAIALSTRAHPLTSDGNPYHEIAAGHLLAEMVANGETVGNDGRTLLSKEEVDRIERYYGKADPVTKEVKARRLTINLVCLRYGTAKTGIREVLTPYRYNIWVWDWGREESPTESQMRSLEYATGCYQNRDLRETLSQSFRLASKNKIPFADLIQEQIKAAVAVEAQAAQKASRR